MNLICEEELGRVEDTCERDRVQLKLNPVTCSAIPSYIIWTQPYNVPQFSISKRK